MGKNKLRRFAENETFPHLFQPKMSFPLVDHPLKGRWLVDFFKNDHPITLELGCGRGEYTVAMSAMYPERNFIGIDWKGARLWRGAKTTLERGQSNAAFLRIMISNISAFFSSQDKVQEIWITFPDPQLEQRRERKRLTSPRFLDLYRSFAAPGCVVNLKTDSLPLAEFTLDVLREQQLPVLLQTSDLYSEPWVDQVLSIKTTYENIWLAKGAKINYIKFQL